MDENNIIDVDFQEEQHESSINGKPLYYTTSQVGQMIGETDSTIRFWCSKFVSIIKPEMSGSHRRFKEEDIEKLKYIKKLLRDENYSINQVIEYAGETNKGKIEKQVQNREPLAMQALATAVAIEVGSQLEDYKLMIKEELINEIRQNFKEQQDQQQANKEEIKDYLSLTIQENIKEQLTDFKAYMDTKESEAKERDTNILDTLKNGMEEREKMFLDQQEKQKNRGLFSKIFGK